jgi:aminoglycoside phosphotransferase (APT) family kinase protein
VRNAAGRQVGLRRPPPGRLLATAHDIAREKRILRALEATAVPVPSVLAFTGKTAPEAGLRRRGGWPTASGRRCRRGRGSRCSTATYLRNLAFARDGSRVRAVLDWQLATLVDPLADLGSLLTCWPEAGEPGPAVFAASALPRFPSRIELFAAYVRAAGRSPEALPFWHALGLWKLAAIADGVRRRSAAGRAAAPSLSECLVEHRLACGEAVATAAGL